MTLHTLD